MTQDLSNLNPVPWPDPQAGSDQVLASFRNIVSKDQFSIADLIISLKGDVPTDHVIEQDPQGPNGGFIAKVPGAPDPLWRRIGARSLKFSIL